MALLPAPGLLAPGRPEAYSPYRQATPKGATYDPTKTAYPGIYKREGKRGTTYIVRYRSGNGKQRAETCRTLKQALRFKRERESARDRGEQELDRAARRPFAEHARAWIESYGPTHLSPATEAEYRRDLARALDFIGEDRTLAGLNQPHVAAYVAHLAAQGLAPATIRRTLTPLRSCLSEAVRHGLIRVNPCDGVRLPRREQDVPDAGDDDEGGKGRALSREQLRVLLDLIHPRWRPFFRLLAATGLRWQEATALRRGDLALAGSNPVIRVRRSVRYGRFGPPKSKAGRRDVPITPELVSELRRHLASLRPDGPDSLAFPNDAGNALIYPNVRQRVLVPAAQEAGVPWCGFHTFRHTFASFLLAGGVPITTVSKLLGHSNPAITLSVYAHFIPGDEAPALDLDAELDRENEMRTPVAPRPVPLSPRIGQSQHEYGLHGTQR